ncbi:MAG: transposon-encoded TnpW family protein [Lachnospiraceae bacterium]
MLDCGKDKATKLFRELEGTDLVKRIGNTTFDIHIHFSETSRETFTDKVVRLIENDKDSVIYV